jgi:hypothetical protein
MINKMSPTFPRARVLQVAVALELVWAVFLGYEVHRQFAGSQLSRFGVPWDVKVLTFMQQWAAPAIAIVVAAWVVDLALTRLRA